MYGNNVGTIVKSHSFSPQTAPDTVMPGNASISTNNTIKIIHNNF
ncbi:MAG: hypothetical protein ACI4DS_05580 [Eubacterium sp.]